MTGFSPQGPPPGAGDPSQQPGQPSEEEVRAAMEEQLRSIRVQDLLLESVVQIINLTARRLLKEDERDLEQARVGIDSVRALVDMLDGEQAESVKRALSELQMHFVQISGGGEPAAPDAGEDPAAASQQPPASPQQPPAPPQQRPGGEPPPRLWTPGRD